MFFIMTKLEKFIETLEQAILGNKGIRVLITMPNLPKPEIITNPSENVKTKLEYYRVAYNEKLELKNNPVIVIEHYEVF